MMKAGLIAIAVFVAWRAVQPASVEEHPLIMASGLWGLPPHDLPDVHAEAAEAPKPDTGTPQGSGGRVIYASARIDGFADICADGRVTVGTEI